DGPVGRTLWRLGPRLAVRSSWWRSPTTCGPTAGHRSCGSSCRSGPAGTKADPMNGARYVVGIDFGTLSGRAVVVRVSDGAEMGSAVHAYRHGVMDETLAATGAALPPDWALQVPADYRDVLRVAVPEAVAPADVAPTEVVGIAVDFTACTV